MCTCVLCAYVHLCVCTCVHAYMSTCVHVYYVHMCICVCVYMCTCVHVLVSGQTMCLPTGMDHTSHQSHKQQMFLHPHVYSSDLQHQYGNYTQQIGLQVTFLLVTLVSSDHSNTLTHTRLLKVGGLVPIVTRQTLFAVVSSSVIRTLT